MEELLKVFSSVNELSNKLSDKIFLEKRLIVEYYNKLVDIVDIFSSIIYHFCKFLYIIIIKWMTIKNEGKKQKFS